MKKIYAIAIALVLAGSFSAQAQLKFGVLGGANFSKINSTNPDVLAQNLTAWHAGLMTEIRFPLIGIEVDAIYTQNGSKVDLGQGFQDLKNTYIALPVVAKVYMLKVLSLQVGPQFSWLTSSKLDAQDFKDQLKSNDLQIVFGAGVDLSMLHASLRYHLGVKDINANTAANFDLKNNAVMLTVGIWLKK